MDLSTTVAALLTLAMFSFLYRDNPCYRFAEHLLIGLSVGFTVVLLFNSVLMAKLFLPLFKEGQFGSLIPLILGLSMFARLSSKMVPYSKPALALIIGAGAGASIPRMLEARTLQQLSATVEPFAAMEAGTLSDPWLITTAVITLVGVASVMVYFFYTRPDTKPIRAVSRIGVYFLMVFFGATFGYTATSRLSLLIGRLEFLLGDFLGIL